MQAHRYGLAIALLGALAMGRPAAADDPRASDSLRVARDLYSAAEYDSALEMLNRLRSGTLTGEDVADIEQYRAYCLLALGRSSDAEQAIAAVITADPGFTPADPNVSPRLKAAFRDVRARTLPTVIRQEYDSAKAAFDRREFAAAAVGFAGVLRLMADPDVAAQASAPPLSDIRKLAEGFRELSTAAAVPASGPAPAPAVEVPSDAPVSPAAPASSSSTAVSASQGPSVSGSGASRPAASAIYTLDDPGVAAPVPVKQTLPPFTGLTTSARQGVLDVLIDERGLVQSAVMRVPIDPRYDRLVVDAARAWKYEPATLAGVPVKYRKLVQIVIRR